MKRIRTKILRTVEELIGLVPGYKKKIFILACKYKPQESEIQKMNLLSCAT